MNKIFFVFVIAVSVSILACSSGSSGGADGPSAAYKRLYAAVRSKNTDAIKAELTKKSISLNDTAAKQYKKTDQQAYETGMTATTAAESLPPMRDERVNGESGAVEVWNAKDNRWEDLPFIVEDGKWKLAMGELFAGAFKSPGKGQDFREREAANATGGADVPKPAVNANGSVPKMLPLNTSRTNK
jgi:hypothetical protein